MSLGSEEKQRIIKALEEDREFRYALMGLLGYREILDRITGLEERFADLEERFIKLEERFAELGERFAKLEERVAKLEERVTRLEEEARETRRVLTVIAHRFGVISETGFREAMKYVLQDLFGIAKVEKVTIYDEKGLVYGHPANIDIDILVRDREHVLIEIKSRTSRGDVAELYRIGRLYEERTGIRPRLVIVSGFIDPEAIETARELNVEIKPLSKDLVGITTL